MQLQLNGLQAFLNFPSLILQKASEVFFRGLPSTQWEAVAWKILCPLSSEHHLIPAPCRIKSSSWANLPLFWTQSKIHFQCISFWNYLPLILECPIILCFCFYRYRLFAFFSVSFSFFFFIKLPWLHKHINKPKNSDTSTFLINLFIYSFIEFCATPCGTQGLLLDLHLRNYLLLVVLEEPLNSCWLCAKQNHYLLCYCSSPPIYF